MRQCSASTDMWTDEFKHLAYSTLTLHYIEKNWTLCTKVLFTCEFPADDKKTGMNIKNELKNSLLKCGLKSDPLDKLTFVTDQGSNIVKALQDSVRLNCS